jgi:hypothetical protein
VRTTLPTIGLVVLLSGCSPAVTTAPPAESLGTDLFTPCADIFRPGQIILRAEALTACAATDGTSRTPQYLRCVDGRRLWRIDETMSPTPGWGFGGNTFQATTDFDSDPDFTAALRTCRG